MKFGSDGESYVNIYSKGVTPLGRALSNFSQSEIDTPDGKFQSVEGYWYWLGTNHPDRDQLRNLYGFEAKRIGRALGSRDWQDNAYFKLKIISAILSKLLKDESLLKAFKANKLPFRHYYNYEGKIVEPVDGKWIVDTFTFLQSIL